MLRLLALLAGLVFLALLAFVFTRAPYVAPVSTPTEGVSLPPAIPSADPLSSVEVAERTANAPAAPDAHFVSIVGELVREGDGRVVEGGVVTFSYRYLSQGPLARVRKVPVDVDERGQFEQLFSEPVELVACRIEPVEIEQSGWQFDSVDLRRADFLRAERTLDVRVNARGVRIPLQVRSGLEITGRVFDASTNEPQAGALVHVLVDFEHMLGTRTNSGGTFRMRGLDPKLSERDRKYVAVESLAPDCGRFIEEFRLCAVASGHSPGSTVVPLPLSPARPTCVDIAVRRGVRVSGKVLDFAGKPVPKARVDITMPPDPQAEDSRELVRVQATLTDADGSFSFDSVELAEGCEVRARHPWQEGPAPHIALGTVRQDRPGMMLTLPDTQCYRIQVRDTDGTPLIRSEFQVSLRDVWGERIIDGTETVRVYAIVGARTNIVVSLERKVDGKLVALHANAVLEPLVRAEEPVTVLLDLEP